MTRSFKKRDALLSYFKQSPAQDFRTAKIDDHDDFKALTRHTSIKHHLSRSWQEIYKTGLANKYRLKRPKWQRNTFIY
jgi:hypothetical protein